MDWRNRLSLGLFGFLALVLTSPINAGSRQDPDAYREAVLKSKALILGKKSQEAIELFLDPMIATFKNDHLEPNSYCLHARAEVPLYQKVAKKADQPLHFVDGIKCDVIYMKAVAKIELGEIDKAGELLQQVIALEPAWPEYLNEMGFVYELRQDWLKSIDLFTRAENNAQLLADKPMTSRACRGIGFVQTELKHYEAARLTYQRCLTFDSGDEKSRRELLYIDKQLGDPI